MNSLLSFFSIKKKVIIKKLPIIIPKIIDNTTKSDSLLKKIK